MFRALLFCILLLSAFALQAAESNERDRFLVVPYLWAINIEAGLELGQLAVPVSVGTGDLISDLEYGGLGYAQWNIDRNFIFFEGILVNFDADEFRPVFDQALQVDFKFAEIGYGRHFKFGAHVVSPHIGILHGYLDATVSGELNEEIHESWTGGIIGATVNGPLSESFSYTLRGQYSSFSSNLEDFATVLVGVNYHMTDRVALSFGYRLLQSNYNNDGLVLNTDFEGILSGLQFSW